MTIMESFSETCVPGVKWVGNRGGVVRDTIFCCLLYCWGHPCRMPRPTRGEPFAARLVYQMASSSIHWGHFLLVCCGSVSGGLSLMRTVWSLSVLSLIRHSCSLSSAPWPAPACPCVSAPSVHALEVKQPWTILLERVSVFVWQYVNQSFVELIFNAWSLAYPLLSLDSWLWEIPCCSVISMLTSLCFPFPYT